MTHAAAFALGVLATLGMLWMFVYLFSTREETARMPRDPRTEELAVLAATGVPGLRWW